MMEKSKHGLKHHSTLEIEITKAIYFYFKVVGVTIALLHALTLFMYVDSRVTGYCIECRNDIEIYFIFPPFASLFFVGPSAILLYPFVRAYQNRRANIKRKNDDPQM